MIKGTGIDIVEISRIKKSLEKNNRFQNLVFSKNEIDYCSKKGLNKESYAGRFAAKEALLKALGTGWSGKLNLNELEVLNDDSGKPYFVFLGKSKEILTELNNDLIHVSISHSKEYATAIVIIEERN